MAERSIIYHLSVQGAQQVKSELDQVRQRFDQGGASIGELRDVQRTATQTARVFNQEQRISHNLFLAMHPNIRRAGEAMQTFSRITGLAMNAMNAINLAQLVFNQKASGQMEMANNLRQAERELAIAIKTGAGEQELANLRENAELARSKMKEFNDELNQQRFSNYFTFAASIGHLASGFGAIVTRSPEIVNLFRRIGGSFFGGTPSGGGGPPSVGGTGSFSRGGFGAPGAPGVGVPTMAGRCVEICGGAQAGIASKVGSQFKDKLATLIPYLIPIAATAAIMGGIYTLLGSGILNVWVVNFPGGKGVTPPGANIPTPGLGKTNDKVEEGAKELAKGVEKTGRSSNDFGDAMENLGFVVPAGIATVAAGVIFALRQVGPGLAQAAQTSISRLLAIKIPNIESWGFEQFKRQEAFAESGGVGMGGGSSKGGIFARNSKTDLSKVAGPFRAQGGMHSTLSSDTAILAHKGERVDISPSGQGSGMTIVNYITVQGNLWTTDSLYNEIDRRWKSDLRWKAGLGT